MDGGDGADVLDGGIGPDRLRGGAGPDDFLSRFTGDRMVDVIEDFNPAEGDRLVVQAESAAEAGHLFDRSVLRRGILEMTITGVGTAQLVRLGPLDTTVEVLAKRRALVISGSF